MQLEKATAPQSMWSASLHLQFSQERHVVAGGVKETLRSLGGAATPAVHSTEILCRQTGARKPFQPVAEAELRVFPARPPVGLKKNGANADGMYHDMTLLCSDEHLINANRD